MARRSRYPGEDILRYLYEEKRLSLEQIGRIFGVTREAIRVWFIRAGIKPRDRIQAVKTRGPKKRVSVRELRKELKAKYPEVAELFGW
jgi:hypothetical protein